MLCLTYEIFILIYVNFSQEFVYSIELIFFLASNNESSTISETAKYTCTYLLVDYTQVLQYT